MFERASDLFITSRSVIARLLVWVDISFYRVLECAAFLCAVGTVMAICELNCNT
jgi:hypothetical protein